jgi:hypothetical protein
MLSARRSGLKRDGELHDGRTDGIRDHDGARHRLTLQDEPGMTSSPRTARRCYETHLPDRSGSNLVKPDPVAGKVTNRGASGHTFSVVRGSDFGGAGIDGAGVAGIEFPEGRPAGVVHTVLARDEMQQQEVILAVCAEDER